MGADDYITKPFSQRLLIERIRALLRREKGGPETACRGRRRRRGADGTRGDLTAGSGASSLYLEKR